MVRQRFLLVTFPAHRHINPALQFAKQLISMGADVTLPLTLNLYPHLANKITIPGLSFVPFSDGYDAGYDTAGVQRRDCRFESFQEQILQLDRESNPTVLVNTFEDLEVEALRAVDRINMIPIGPLVNTSCVLLEGKEEKVNAEELYCREELEKRGKIVRWCAQVEGVRVDENGIVTGQEIKRCLELAMGSGTGPKGNQFRNNANKWKGLAMEAAKEGASSHRNLKAFIHRIAQHS
ncbi:hypothetical protein VNO78_11255 [Psophocarpus tetragonolobus]|uniref:Uncharacterized protein n=1 Tax=Psophocarpus tetragonolobus TaxID=3891 RepID=A0AAN9SNW6_PSOTE